MEHNVNQFQHLKEKYFQSFSFFILPPKSFKCSKYKNIQESGYCSKLHLLLNNNKVFIYKKHNIYYPEYCYKMKIFTIYLGGVVVVQVKNNSHETTFIHAQVNNTKTHNSTSLTLVGACVMCISIWQISFKLLCKGKINVQKVSGCAWNTNWNSVMFHNIFHVK